VLRRSHMDSFPAISQHNSCPNGYKETIGTVVKEMVNI